MSLEVDPVVREVMQREFIAAIKAEGLVLIPSEAATFSAEFFIQQKQALDKVSVTPYKIAKLHLLPDVKTLKTIKDMIADGRISKAEYYTNASGKIHVLTSAIKRMRNE